VDDARRLMGDLDGSVLDLVNGHVMHLIGALTDKDAAIAEARADDARKMAERIEGEASEHYPGELRKDFREGLLYAARIARGETGGDDDV